jgi:hypothetical protein
MVDSVATKRLSKDSGANDTTDVVVNFDDVTIGNTDVLVTLHAFATGVVNVPALNGNTGIHCVISATDEDGKALEVSDTDFNYPSSTMAFSASCSAAIIVKSGQPIKAKASCIAYGDQRKHVTQRRIKAIAILQAIKDQELTK